MSGGHQGQSGTPVRIRKSSPNPTKQGPMKATIPIACVLKRNNNLKNVSPTSLSPPSYWTTRISPDCTLDQQKSPAYYKASKSRALSASSNTKTLEVMRKTVSLDSIYKWSREDYLQSKSFRPGIHASNEQNFSDEDLSRKIGNGGDCGFLILRPKFANNEDKQVFLSKSLPTSAIGIPEVGSRLHTPSSLEGINQDSLPKNLLTREARFAYIQERVNRLYQATPEGRRAPVKDFYWNRKSPVSDSPPRDLDSPTLLNQLSVSSTDADSTADSPNQEVASSFGTSPRPNKFASHIPPIGCERTAIIKAQSVKNPVSESTNVQQPSSFQLQPSIHTAFDVLKPVAIKMTELQTNPQEDSVD